MPTGNMNSTKVQNPRRKMQVALLAEPKTPLESNVFIKYYEHKQALYCHLVYCSVAVWKDQATKHIH